MVRLQPALLAKGRFGALSFCPRATARRQSRPVPHVWRVVCARPRGATLAAAKLGPPEVWEALVRHSFTSISYVQIWGGIAIKKQ